MFNSTLRREGLNFGIFLFFLSGGDDYITDAPWSAGPSMNRLFLGARSSPGLALAFTLAFVGASVVPVCTDVTLPIAPIGAAYHRSRIHCLFL